MVRRLLAVACVFMVSGCAKALPGYNRSVSVHEGGVLWEVRVKRALFMESMVKVDVEYANRSGAAFSVRAEDLVIMNDAGGRWVADGRMIILPLLQPGQTQSLIATFQNVPVGKEALYLHPMRALTHEDPKFLLKAAGGQPLLGEHTDEHWDIAK